MADDDKPDEKMIEEDHPQTREAEPNARGSSQWHEDVQAPRDELEEDPERPTVKELAHDAAKTRRKAIGKKSPRHAFGSDKASRE